LLRLAPQSIAIGEELPASVRQRPSAARCTNEAGGVDGAAARTGDGTQETHQQAAQGGAHLEGSLPSPHPGAMLAGSKRHRPGPLVPGNVLDMDSSAAAVAAIAAAVAAPVPHSSRQDFHLRVMLRMSPSSTPRDVSVLLVTSLQGLPVANEDRATVHYCFSSQNNLVSHLF
jgi:hypothetical protein